MTTTTAQITRRRPQQARPEPMRIRAQLPAVTALRGAIATHDFLVPNPRPDLILDHRTLRMIEVQ